ncbi:MAG: 2-iminoacetate synthase ThiH [bacterium]
MLDIISFNRSPLVKRFERLLQPDADLEGMAREAQRLTRQYFGRTMRLFAPLYLSNECVNNCAYCGFARRNDIPRVTLTPEQAEAEARHLFQKGFRNILLVAGEHPQRVSPSYLSECVRRLKPYASSISLEVGPMETEQYRSVVEAGAEGLVVYQETYQRAAYAELHPSGPKKNFEWRLDCPERAYEAGFRRIGIGALLGLWDWREETIALAAHAEYLLKRCWKAFLTISLPRLRPASGGFQPRVELSDKEYTQLICALRICFPQAGIVLSTREAPRVRDGLMQLGVTLASAGSQTEPGGYALNVEQKTTAGEQFAISDDRTVEEFVARLREQGLDPVWKDWDHALSFCST